MACVAMIAADFFWLVLCMNFTGHSYNRLLTRLTNNNCDGLFKADRYGRTTSIILHVF